MQPCSCCKLIGALWRCTGLNRLPCAQVVQFVKNPEYSHFSHIIFDTAPTGHTLRLLTLPDFLDASLGALNRLRGSAPSNQTSLLWNSLHKKLHCLLHIDLCMSDRGYGPRCKDIDRELPTMCP